MEYPKYKYHPENGSVVVDSKESEDALDGKWFNSPAEYGVETCPGLEPDEKTSEEKEPGDVKGSSFRYGESE